MIVYISEIIRISDEIETHNPTQKYSSSYSGLYYSVVMYWRVEQGILAYKRLHKS